MVEIVNNYDLGHLNLVFVMTFFVDDTSKKVVSGAFKYGVMQNSVLCDSSFPSRFETYFLCVK